MYEQYLWDKPQKARKNVHYDGANFLFEWKQVAETLVPHFYTLIPPIMDSRVGKLDCVYCTVKYSNSAYFLGYVLVDAHSLHSYTVMYSTKCHGMRLIYTVVG